MTKTTKTTKSTKTKKNSTKVTPVDTTAVEVAPVETNTVVNEVQVSTDDSDPNFNDVTKDLLDQLNKLRSQITTISAQVRSIRSKHDKEIKQAIRQGKQRRNANRTPCGFIKPALISNELATFLDKPQGSMMPRTQVTREINAYIRENKLQDPSFGRRILPDDNLKKLLRLKKNDELTYFNLQRYMKHHFPKPLESQSA